MLRREGELDGSDIGLFALHLFGRAFEFDCDFSEFLFQAITGLADVVSRFLCSGDAVITIDADLQHPPSLIPAMLARWREADAALGAGADHTAMYAYVHQRQGAGRRGLARRARRRLYRRGGLGQGGAAGEQQRFAGEADEVGQADRAIGQRQHLPGGLRGVESFVAHARTLKNLDDVFDAVIDGWDLIPIGAHARGAGVGDGGDGFAVTREHAPEFAGMQFGFAELVNKHDTPGLLRWIEQIAERPAVKQMYAEVPMEQIGRAHV